MCCCKVDIAAAVTAILAAITSAVTTITTAITASTTAIITEIQSCCTQMLAEVDLKAQDVIDIVNIDTAAVQTDISNAVVFLNGVLTALSATITTAISTSQGVITTAITASQGVITAAISAAVTAIATAISASETVITIAISASATATATAIATATATITAAITSSQDYTGYHKQLFAGITTTGIKGTFSAPANLCFSQLTIWMKTNGGSATFTCFARAKTDPSQTAYGNQCNVQGVALTGEFMGSNLIIPMTDWQLDITVLTLIGASSIDVTVVWRA